MEGLVVIEALEIATHPEDLCIALSKSKKCPERFGVQFLRGEGHHYKPMVTMEDESTYLEMEKALKFAKYILTIASLQTIVECMANRSADEFIEAVRKAGFDENVSEDERLRQYWEKRGPESSLLAGCIDLSLILNATMIDEIIARLEADGFCDTSVRPLTTSLSSNTDNTN